MLIKRTERHVRRGPLAGALPGQSDGALDRRAFLRRSGLVGGGAAALGLVPLGSVRKAEAGPPPPAGAQVTIRKNICTHCSVGCTVVAEVANGVWIGQEPGWDSPLNRGSHCAKGAAVRELVHGDRGRQYPMKLVNGQWTRVSWDVAINEIGDKLMAIREKSGPDSVYWLGSAKFTNEGAYLNRKLAAFWGTNNSDHQARICHSTTVAGVANTWGYGAMTNSYTDIRNAKTMIIMGGNPAEAHPVSLQHLLEGKEMQRANMIVIDPRMTRTAAHATEYVRIRSGTDIPVIWGMLWHIFKNGWEDKQFIEQRVYGMDDIRKEVEKYPPDEVDKIPGPDGKEISTMNTPGIPSTRWFDATLYEKKDVSQKDNIKCMFVMGHGGNTLTRMPNAQTGIEALDLLVVADPHPTTWAALAPNRKNNTYHLPIATSYETAGSRTASNRALQWGEQIVKPIFEAKDDNEVMYLLAKKLGFADAMFKNIKVENNQPSPEDLLREINRGGFSTGYSGQSPERLKAHMKNQGKFDLVTLRAKADEPDVGGDYYGLPWPCWGTPQIRHPGTHTLYNTNLHAKDGGGTFRARFGVVYEEKQPDGSVKNVNLPAEGSYSKGSELTDGYPEFTYGVLKKLGWDKDLTEAELATINKIGGNNPDGVGWAVDLSGGIIRVTLEHGVMAYGNGKARAVAWNLPDPVPVHREPIYTPRPELVAKYPTRPDGRQFRMANPGFSIQKAAVDKGLAKQFPIILTSGRLVEYEGGGEETRSNRWLAELQQDMFVEVNTADAAERGIKDGGWVWVYGPENSSKAKVKDLVTDRVGKRVAFMPFHFSGWFQGVDQRGKYPKGSDPIVLGESVNTLTSFGYDPVTGMHEGKATLCQIQAA